MSLFFFFLTRMDGQAFQLHPKGLLQTFYQKEDILEKEQRPEKECEFFFSESHFFFQPLQVRRRGIFRATFLAAQKAQTEIHHVQPSSRQ